MSKHNFTPRARDGQTLTRTPLITLKVKYKVLVTIFERDDSPDLSYHVKFINAERKQIFDPDQELKILTLVKKGLKGAKASAQTRKEIFETYGNEWMTEDPFAPASAGSKNQALQEARSAVNRLLDTFAEARP